MSSAVKTTAALSGATDGEAGYAKDQRRDHKVLFNHLVTYHDSFSPGQETEIKKVITIINL